MEKLSVVKAIIKDIGLYNETLKAALSAVGAELIGSSGRACIKVGNAYYKYSMNPYTNKKEAMLLKVLEDKELPSNKLAWMKEIDDNWALIEFIPGTQLEYIRWKDNRRFNQLIAEVKQYIDYLYDNVIHLNDVSNNASNVIINDSGWKIIDYEQWRFYN